MTIFITSSVGIYVDCILLFRVTVVFPRRTTPTRTWIAILEPLLLLKLARVVNLIIFLVQFVTKTQNVSQDSSVFDPLVKSLRGETVEWSLQLLDNT